MFTALGRLACSLGAVADQAVFGLEIEIGFRAFFAEGGWRVDLDFDVLVAAMCIE